MPENAHYRPKGCKFPPLPGYAEFRSDLFGFVDDVEFSFYGGSKVIHVKSASRVGYSDMGANRKRVEEIRKLFSSKE